MDLVMYLVATGRGCDGSGDGEASLFRAPGELSQNFQAEGG